MLVSFLCFGLIYFSGIFLLRPPTFSLSLLKGRYQDADVTQVAFSLAFYLILSAMLLLQCFLSVDLYNQLVPSAGILLAIKLQNCFPSFQIDPSLFEDIFSAVIDGGLILPLMVILIGWLIHGLYLLFRKGGALLKLPYLLELNRQDESALLIISCLIIGIMGAASGLLHLLFACLALMIGKFFWLDYQPHTFKNQIFPQFRALPKVVLPLLVCLAVMCAIVFTSDEERLLHNAFLGIFAALPPFFVTWLTIKLVFPEEWVMISPTDPGKD